MGQHTDLEKYKAIKDFDYINARMKLTASTSEINIKNVIIFIINTISNLKSQS